MELLLYSESKNCALLKEAAIDYIVENKDNVIKKNLLSFVDVPGTLLNDMLVAFIRSEKKDGAGGGIDGFASMRVSELRKKAHEKGLNVDGSREMLITALKLEDNEESDEE